MSTTRNSEHERSQNITKLPSATKRRLPTIIKGLLIGETHEQIALQCGVRRETISRDLMKWRGVGGFDDWVEKEFFRLHGQTQSGPIPAETAYKVLARMKEKAITSTIKANLETYGGIEYRITIVDEVKTDTVEQDDTG